MSFNGFLSDSVEITSCVYTKTIILSVSNSGLRDTYLDFKRIIVFMIRIFKNIIIIHYQTIEKGEGVYKLHNLHHTDHICHTHCWLTRGGLASVILISSAIFCTRKHWSQITLFKFSFQDLKAVFIQRQLIFDLWTAE